jgi:hypothetical protein
VISIPIGFIETAMIPATSVLTGALGTIAENINTTTPTQLIIGDTGHDTGTCSQWRSSPAVGAVSMPRS